MFIICMCLYTLYDLEYYDTYMVDERWQQSWTLRLLVWAFTAYFGSMEFRQLMISGPTSYFRNGWNLMDVSLFTLIITAECIEGRFGIKDPSLIGDQNYLPLAQVVRTLYSFAVIIMWIRFLYFFRIFRSTGYYIRMLIQVIRDIKYFIFIYVLTIVAFAHAWFVYFKNSSQGSSLPRVTDALIYVYMIAFSNYNTGEFGDYYIQISWLFFVFCTFFLQIVLVNLLISIVADTFSRIKSNYNVIMYKDMLHMIIENRFLAVGPLTQELNHKYLLMCWNTSQA